jgi:hypothetical protein
MAKISSLKQAVKMFQKEVRLELAVKKLQHEFPDNVEVLRFYNQGQIYGTMVCVEGKEGLESCCYHGKHPYLDKTPEGQCKRETLQIVIESVTSKPEYPDLFRDPDVCYLRGDANDVEFLGVELSDETAFKTKSAKYMDKLKDLRKL